MSERRVYAIHVTLTVAARVFVLASDQEAARTALRDIDLQELLAVTPEHITTDTDYMRFDAIAINPHPLGSFVVAINPHPLGYFMDPTPLSDDQYPPNAHPDFTGAPYK